MTTSQAIASLSDIVADLSRELPADARFQRLLQALMSSFPCDAAALLQLEDDCLLPRAVNGLSREALGRRFWVSEQPRLREILHSRGPVRFSADSELPDPYDGLIDSLDGHLYVHDCLGAPLHVDGKPWGVLTLDALTPGRFEELDLELFESYVAVAAASIRAADVIDTLESELEHRQLVQMSWAAAVETRPLIAESAPMLRLIREAEIVAKADVPVLILGETGVGKELVARHIHRHSPRALEAMVQVNCAALPESIAESELFGHVKGAFSGAGQDRAGKFELADRGTLVLDEIGELPLSIQAKLLRALQSGELQRVGSDRAHRCDVRVVAVTNRNLEAEVKARRFRADLFHRLNVYPLVVPPLRERRSDVALLAGAFIQECERKLGLRGVRLSAAGRQWITQYDWPGNVRELEHAITRAVVKALAEGQSRRRIIELGPRHLGADPSTITELAARDQREAVPDATYAEALEQFKRRLFESRLRQHEGNVAAAARSLGLDRANFYRMCKRLGLR